MATVNQTNLTLSGLASRQQDKKIAKIIEMMSETNEILEDMPWLEANNGTNHKTTVRSGLPTIAWRLLNYGVAKSRSSTVQVQDSCGRLEGFNEIDEVLVELAKDQAAFRLSEDKGFFQQFNNTMASTLFYGNIETDPEKFMGLAPRYDDLSAENAENIIDGEGTGSDNTSIWFVTWGTDTCHGIYPQGTKMGLTHEDMGKETVSDSDGKIFRAYRTQYVWNCGLTLRDWRATARIANIDVSDLSDAGETGFDGANIPNLMIKAQNKVLPYAKTGKTVIYCNRTVKTALDLIASNKSNTQFTTRDGVDGMPISYFRGSPIRTCEALLDTESAVS